MIIDVDLQAIHVRQSYKGLGKGFTHGCSHIDCAATHNEAMSAREAVSAVHVAIEA